MKILVPIDDSELSEAALPEALRIGRDGGDFALVLGSVGELPEVSEHAREAREALERRLRSVAGKLPSDLRVTSNVHLAGDPVRGLLEIAEEEHVDRIVMASHERSAFESLVDGSVADELKDALDRIPVTVV